MIALDEEFSSAVCNIDPGRIAALRAAGVPDKAFAAHLVGMAPIEAHRGGLFDIADDGDLAVLLPVGEWDGRNGRLEDIVAFHPDTPETRNDYAVYYDRLQELDGQVGKILDQLRADGLDDSTIVFYYSDHGGAVAGTKRFLTEGGLHVPLLIKVPEQYRHLVSYEQTGTVDRPVSLVDLPPTLLRIAGIDPPAHMAGLSLIHI